MEEHLVSSKEMIAALTLHSQAIAEAITLVAVTMAKHSTDPEGAVRDLHEMCTEPELSIDNPMLQLLYGTMAAALHEAMQYSFPKSP